MNTTATTDPTAPRTVWVAGQTRPNEWLLTTTENPAILVAWSYKTWATKIVKAYLA